MLTSYDGNAITYDGSGNPLSMNGWTFTWQGGRQLAAMSNGTTTLSFAYNDSGLRTSKTVGNTTHTYTYQGSTLVADKTATDAMYFHYDPNGSVIGFTYDNGTTTAEYYYVKNLQGDILGILDASGALVASYSYDAWGNVLSAVNHDDPLDLAHRNPLCNRGYVYDSETELYYLQSRYYNPAVGRFLNADTYTQTYETSNGANMFAYCLNNPVKHADENGEWVQVAIGAVIGAAFGALDAYMSGENVLVGAAIGGVTGAIFAAVPTAIGAKVLSKATSKIGKAVLKNVVPGIHAVGAALVDVGSQWAQSRISGEAFQWDKRSTAMAATTAFSGAKAANYVNKLTGGLFENDKAAEAVYEYVSGVFFGTMDIIKNHWRRK